MLTTSASAAADRRDDYHRLYLAEYLLLSCVSTEMKLILHTIA